MGMPWSIGHTGHLVPEAMRGHFSTDAHAAYQHEVDELLATPSEVVLHQVSSTTRPSASTSPTDPGRFG